MVRRDLLIVVTCSFLGLWPELAGSQNRTSIRLGPDSPAISNFIQLFDEFGGAVASAGDLNGDGHEDILVGAPGTDGGGTDRGAVYVLLLESDLSIRRVQRIDDEAPMVRHIIGNRDKFGSAILNLGDLDDNGTIELVVGVPGANQRRGAIWIVSISPNAIVEAISVVDFETTSRLTLNRGDEFGHALAKLHDLNGDGLPEIAVGAPYADKGMVWTLFLEHSEEGFGIDTTVVQSVRADFTDHILARDDLSFGLAVAQIDDFDDDEIGEIAIGAPIDQFDSPKGSGTILLAGMNVQGSLSRQAVIYSGTSENEQVGSALAVIDDVDGNGLRELLVGAPLKDLSGSDEGEVVRLFLGPGGQIMARDFLSSTEGLDLYEYDRFGSSIAVMSDLDNNGLSDLLIGAPGHERRGSVWIIPTSVAAASVIANVTVLPRPTPSTNDAVSISSEITDDTGVQRAWLDLRLGGEISWLTVPFTALQGHVFSADVPSRFIGERGFEYVVHARNNTGLEARSPREGFHSARLSIPHGVAAEVQRGTGVESYQLISFPIQMENPSARQNLKRNLGSIDKSAWRFLRYSRAGLLDVADQDFDLEQGKAYWIIAGAGDRTVRVGAGKSAPTNTPFEIALDPGWNLFGSPFAFDLPTTALDLRGQALDIRQYERGNWSDSVAVVHPYRGYIIWNDRETTETLVIDPRVRNLASGPARAVVAPLNAARREGLLRELNPVWFGRSTEVGMYDRDASINGVFPNPAKNVVTMQYRVATTGEVTLSVFDMLGRKIAELLHRQGHPSGTFSVTWNTRTSDGKPATPGVYLLRLLIDGHASADRTVTVIR